MEYVPVANKLMNRSGESIDYLLKSLEINKKKWERDFCFKKITFVFAKDLIQYVGKGTKKININVWGGAYTSTNLTPEEILDYLCFVATTKGYTIISKEFPLLVLGCNTEEELKTIYNNDDALC
jgi:hypothetical protein